jgi:hypothetical protein
VLVLAFARAVAITVLLIVTLVGIPVAIERAVRWTFLAQECVLEGRDAAAARRESVRLVRGDWWRTFALVASTNVTVLLTSLLVGVLFLFFVSSLSLSVINVIGAIVYMIGYPYVGIVTTLLYYDRTASRQRAMHPSPVAAAVPSS